MICLGRGRRIEIRSDSGADRQKAGALEMPLWSQLRRTGKIVPAMLDAPAASAARSSTTRHWLCAPPPGARPRAPSLTVS